MLTLRAMSALAHALDFYAAVSCAYASHALRQRKATLSCGLRFFTRKDSSEKIIVGQKTSRPHPAIANSQ